MLCMLLAGCVTVSRSLIEPVRLVPPVIVVGKRMPTKGEYGDVTVRDFSGYIWSASTKNSSFARAIVNSYNVGDTLK